MTLGAGSCPEAEKGRRGLGAGRAKEGGQMLIFPVRPLAAFRLVALDGVTGLLHGPRHETSDRVLLPAHRAHGIDEQMHLGRRMSRYISA